MFHCFDLFVQSRYTNFLSDLELANISSYNCRWPLHPFEDFLCCTKIFFNFVRHNYLQLALFCKQLESYQKILTYCISYSVILTFSSSSLKIPVLTLRCLIHLELTFVQRDMDIVSFFSIGQSVSQYHLLKRLFVSAYFTMSIKNQATVVLWTYS